MNLENLEQKGNKQGGMKQIIRPGVVVSIDPDAATVRVEFGDADGLVSHDLPVLVPKVHKDKAYFMPDVGDHVLCAFLPTGNENGFVIGAFYSKADTPPVSSPDKWHVAFSDGTTIEYDRGSSKLTIDCVGDVTVKAAGNIDAAATGNAAVTAGGQAKVTAPTINLTGAVTITGPLTVSGQTTLGSGVGVTGSATVYGDITATGTIIDQGGNTSNHSH